VRAAPPVVASAPSPAVTAGAEEGDEEEGKEAGASRAGTAYYF